MQQPVVSPSKHQLLLSDLLFVLFFNVFQEFIKERLKNNHPVSVRFPRSLQQRSGSVSRQFVSASCTTGLTFHRFNMEEEGKMKAEQVKLDGTVVKL